MATQRARPTFRELSLELHQQAAGNREDETPEGFQVWESLEGQSHPNGYKSNAAFPPSRVGVATTRPNLGFWSSGGLGGRRTRSLPAGRMVGGLRSFENVPWKTVHTIAASEKSDLGDFERA